MFVRGVAQPGSASALGAEGREFESHRPDQYKWVLGLHLRPIFYFKPTLPRFTCLSSGITPSIPLIACAPIKTSVCPGRRRVRVVDIFSGS